MLYKVTLKAILRRFEETDPNTPMRAELMGSFEELGRDVVEISGRLEGQFTSWVQKNIPELKDETGGGDGGGGARIVHAFPPREQ